MLPYRTQLNQGIANTRVSLHISNTAEIMVDEGVNPSS